MNILSRLKAHLATEITHGVRWFHVHLVILVVLLASVGSFAAGDLFGSGGGNALLSPHTWQHRFGRSVAIELSHPPMSVKLPVQLTSTPPQLAGSIDRRYDDGPSQQGSLPQCACYAFAREWDYLYNRRNHTHKHFSCAFWFALFSRGSLVGSTLEDYVSLLDGTGGVFRSQYDYPPYPTAIRYPVPGQVVAAAAAHRYNVVTHPISLVSGGGLGAQQAIEHSILAHRPVFLGHPVYTGSGANGDFDANANDGVVDLPSDNSATLAGYHAVSIIGFNATLCRGTVCGFDIGENNWGPEWGVNCDTLQYVPGHNGCALYSFRFVEQDGFDMSSLALQPNLNPAGPPLPYLQPGANADHQLPPPRSAPANPVLGLGAMTSASSNATYVYHVYAKDRSGYDLARQINPAARQHGLSAVGVTSTILAECGLYTTSTTCDRVIPPYDVSFGCCQVTVGTAAQFGVGTGVFDGYYGSNVSYVRAVDNEPARAVPLAADVLASYAAIERERGCYGAAVYPNLDVAWNAGPYQPCSFLEYPSGQAGANFYQNFLGNYRVAFSYAVAYDPYAKQPPMIHCGRRIGHPKLYGKGRGRYYKATLQHCFRFTWPGYGWAQKTLRR